MASKPHNRIMVYNTKTGLTYAIHPQMAKDPNWMAQRGLILQRDVKPFEVTNLTEAVTEKPTAPKATTKSK